jgi:hypothetical protein
MAATITYRQLQDKLRKLGFKHHYVEVQNKPCNIFEHKTIPNAMIFLPEYVLDDEVVPFHVNTVLTTLKSHGLVRECNPLLT